jgi:hypothetical protein
MTVPPTYREVIEQPRFVEELKAIHRDARRADDFVDGARWALGRDPSVGTHIGKGHVWILPIAEFESADPVALFYTFDDDHVYLLSIRKTVYPPEPEA